jgi:hypothetical protein
LLGISPELFCCALAEFEGAFVGVLPNEIVAVVVAAAAVAAAAAATARPLLAEVVDEEKELEAEAAAASNATAPPVPVTLTPPTMGDPREEDGVPVVGVPLTPGSSPSTQM